MTVYYCDYAEPTNGFTHDELVELNRTEHNLFARAEDSGSEGCYVEVARYHYDTWYRYAFSKFLDGDTEGMSAVEAAKKHAAEINAGGCTLPLIFNLERYPRCPN